MNKILLGGLRSAVTQDNVEHFVGQYARNFGFVIGRRKQAGVYEHWPDGKGEDIDTPGVDYFPGKWVVFLATRGVAARRCPMRWTNCCRSSLLTTCILTAHLRGGLFTKEDVLVFGNEIEPRLGLLYL